MSYIIVTGGSEGLGLEVCKAIQASGDRAVCLSRKAPPLEIEHISVDLCNEEEIKKAAALIKEKYADFSALINCAGVIFTHQPDAIDYQQVDYLMKLNVLAPMVLVSQLHQHILKNEADIVNVLSTISQKAYSEQAAYGASKWALRGLTQNQQLEFKNTKTRVIGFSPGGFRSKFFQKANGKEVDLTPYMDPKHLAEAIMFTLHLPKNMEVSDIIINRKS